MTRARVPAARAIVLVTLARVLGARAQMMEKSAGDFVYLTQRLTPLYPQALVRLLKRILEMLDALLIIFPKAYRLGRPQNLFKVGLELGLFSLCNIKMILDNPLQAPRPEPIPVVADWNISPMAFLS